MAGNVTIEELRAIFSGDATSYQNTVDKVTRSNGQLLESDNKVKNQLGGLSRDLMNAASPMEGLVSIADRLSETFKVGLGVSVFAVGLKAAAEEAKRAIGEMQKFNELFDEAASGKGNALTMSTAQMAANLEKSTKAAQELQHETQRLQEMGGLEALFKPGDAFRVIFGEINTRMEEQKILAEQIEQIYGQIATKEQTRAQLLTAQRTLGEAAARSKEMEARQAEELAQAQERYGAEVAGAVAARHVEERLAFESANEQRTLALKAEQQILLAKREGNAADIRAAQIRLEAARSEFKRAPAATDESRAATNKVIAAHAELESAQRTYALNQSNAILQSRIASLRGAEDDKRIKTLEIERQFLEWKKSNVATPDDMRGIQAEIDRNKAALESARDEKRMRDIAAKSSEVDADAGFGPAEELKALREKAAIAWELVEASKEKANFDEREYRMLVTSAKQAEKEVQQASVRNRLEDVHNKFLEQELKIQGGVQTDVQKRFNITKAQIAATQAEIATLKTLNSELAKAAQLKLQGLQNEQRAQQRQLFGMSPSQRRQFQREQRNEERSNRRVAKKMAANDDLFDVQRDASGRVISGRETPGGPRVQKDQPDLFKSTFDKGEKAKRSAKDAENRKGADEAFRDQFKTSRQRAADAEKRSKEQGEKDKSKDREAAANGNNPVVKELQEIKTKLDNLALA